MHVMLLLIKKKGRTKKLTSMQELALGNRKESKDRETEEW
jgi:hypothetical protein